MLLLMILSNASSEISNELPICGFDAALQTKTSIWPINSLD